MNEFLKAILIALLKPKLYLVTEHKGNEEKLVEVIGVYSDKDKAQKARNDMKTKNYVGRVARTDSDEPETRGDLSYKIYQIKLDTPLSKHSFRTENLIMGIFVEIDA